MALCGTEQVNHCHRDGDQIDRERQLREESELLPNLHERSFGTGFSGVQRADRFAVTLSRSGAPDVCIAMDRETELALVAGLREGSAAAFDAVHQAFQTRLFTFLLRLCRRRDVAEDLLEETWLRLVKHARGLRPDTRLTPWLFTVARNLYVSYQRSRMLEEAHAASLIGLWPSGSTRLSPFEETATNETERRVEAAIAALPAPFREVLL